MNSPYGDIENSLVELDCYPCFAAAHTVTKGENVPRVDAAILEQFSSLVLRAQAGELTSAWSCHPRYLLALILLLDQFPRYVASSKAGDVRAGCREIEAVISSVLKSCRWAKKIARHSWVAFSALIGGGAVAGTNPSHL